MEFFQNFNYAAYSINWIFFIEIVWLFFFCQWMIRSTREKKTFFLSWTAVHAATLKIVVEI